MRLFNFRTKNFLIVGMLFLTACGSSVPISTSTTIPPTSVPITATPLVEDPVLIRKIGSTYVSGTLYGHGEIAVILASRGGYNQSEWAAYAQTLAEEGFTVLTMSSLDSETQTVINVGYAIDFLRGNGFKKIICVGASNGASGCAYHAAEPEMLGIVLITYHGSADLWENSLPKLFLGAELENTYRPVSEREYKNAADPKKLIIVPGSSATGPSLLDTPHQNLNTIVLDFLKQCGGV